MVNIKKALAVGAITIISFPNILFAQEISPSKLSSDIFSGTFIPVRQDVTPLSQGRNIIAKDLPQARPSYLETNDNQEKALDRVYKKVNKLLSDMVDEITRSKSIQPGMWYRSK